MRIFELAVEKVYDNLKDNNTAVNPDTFSSMNQRRQRVYGDNKSSIHGGFDSEVLYLLSGKVPQYLKSKDDIKSALEEIESDNYTNKVASVPLYKKTTVKDISGNEIKLPAAHGYALKSVNNGVITITNPWNSSKNIRLDEKTFIETFSGNKGALYLLDLSDTSDKVNYFSHEFKFDENGNIIWLFDNSEASTSKDTQSADYAKEGMVYTDKRKILNRTYYDKNLQKTASKTYDPRTE